MSQHYKANGKDLLDVIGDEPMDFRAFTAIKYIWRMGLKDDVLQELRKALHYLRLNKVSVSDSVQSKIALFWKKEADKIEDTPELRIQKMIATQRYRAICSVFDDTTDGYGEVELLAHMLDSSRSMLVNIAIVAADNSYIVGAEKKECAPGEVPTYQPKELVDSVDRLIFQKFTENSRIICGSRTRDEIGNRLESHGRQYMSEITDQSSLDEAGFTNVIIGGAATIQKYIASGDLLGILVHRFPTDVSLNGDTPIRVSIPEDWVMEPRVVYFLGKKYHLEIWTKFGSGSIWGCEIKRRLGFI